MARSLHEACQADVIIPVLDLLAGRVVHAVGGRRHEYQSVTHLGLAGDRPDEIARWYQQQYGFSTLYVADLAAIAQRTPDWKSLQELAGLGLQVYADAGWTPQSLAQLGRQAAGVSAMIPVVGTENLSHLSHLAECLAASPHPPVLSVDLMRGRLWNEALRQTTPDELIEFAYGLGYRHFLLLDLSDVGEGKGNSTAPLLDRLRGKLGDAVFWAGGGVRELTDIRTLCAAGFSRVLVATALYRGAIQPPQLQIRGDDRAASKS